MDDPAEACVSGHDHDRASLALDGKDPEKLDRMARNPQLPIAARLFPHDVGLSLAAAAKGSGFVRSWGLSGPQARRGGLEGV